MHIHVCIQCAHMCASFAFTQGFKPKRSLEVMMFTSEEPTRFHLSCIGSRAMAGALSVETLNTRLDENGTDFLTVRVALHTHTHTHTRARARARTHTVENV